MRFLSFLLLVVGSMFSLALFAQTENTRDLKGVSQVMAADTKSQTVSVPAFEHSMDTTGLSSFRVRGIMPFYRYTFRPYRFALSMPWLISGGPMWIHSGLNASIDMGVMIGFGHDNPFHGTSFFTNLSMLYAHPLSDRWTLAAGGTYSRFRMLNSPQNLFSLEAAASYRLSERTSLTGFASHTFSSSSMPVAPFCGVMPNSTTIGLELGVKFSDSFFMQVQVSHTTDGPQRNHGINRDR